jgi:DNA-binding response OmpR family regulator
MHQCKFAQETIRRGWALKKILIADDDVSTVRMIQEVLRRDGYDIVTFGNGPEAITAAKEIKPDLIILDIMMPEMSGLEVLGEIRKDTVNAGTPIIMFSAMPDIDTKLAAFEAGADEYIVKPVDIAEFSARVKAILARQSKSALVQQVQSEKIIDDDPIQILKIRLSKGEISISEYRELMDIVKEEPAKEKPGAQKANADESGSGAKPTPKGRKKKRGRRR